MKTLKEFITEAPTPYQTWKTRLEELKALESKALSAWHAAQRAREAHEQTRPNQAVLQRQRERDAASWANYREPGRDRPTSKGPGYYPGE